MYWAHSCRGRQDWRAALIGAVVSTTLVLTARPVFLRYVSDFGAYNLIYCSIAIVIILVVWAWIVSLILIFGGEIASHVQALVIEEQPVQEVAQRHEERSPARSQPIS